MLKSILDTNNWPILFLIIGTVLITALVFQEYIGILRRKTDVVKITLQPL